MTDKRASSYRRCAKGRSVERLSASESVADEG